MELILLVAVIVLSVEVQDTRRRLRDVEAKLAPAKPAAELPDGERQRLASWLARLAVLVLLVGPGAGAAIGWASAGADGLLFGAGIGLLGGFLGALVVRWMREGVLGA